MFERFTEGARRVVVLAQEDARSLNHNYIGTEHFLLGLLHEGEGTAAQVLEGLGVTFDAVRVDIEEVVGQGVQQPSGHMPFSPRAKAILQSALQESQHLKHNEIDTHHLLLGLLRETDGLAVRILVRLGASPAKVRAGVLDLVARQEHEPPATADRPADPSRDPDASAGTLGRLRGLLGGERERERERDEPAPGSSLAERPPGSIRRATKVARTLQYQDPMGVSLSGRARGGGLDPLVGRRELADRLLATVCRREGNNALLVGESRVGKTALISGLVQTIADGKDGEPLPGTEVWQVAHTALWTARVNALIERGSVAMTFVVEDLDHLLAADRPGPGFAAATLSAICHSSRPLVATISPLGYASLVTDQPLLAAQFQRIDVPPADEAETVAILTGLRDVYQAHHGATITDDAISAAPALAAEFLPGRRLPGAALDLIDTAGARSRVARRSRGESGPAVVDRQLLADVAREIAEQPVRDDSRE